MKTLSWNCRGLGNLGTVRVLKKLLVMEKPAIVFLMETRLKVSQMGRLNETQLHFKGCIPVDCEGFRFSRKGGLCVMWSESVDLELISFSNNHISLKVDEGNGARMWLFSGIYGWPEINKREKTLSLMRNIKPNGGEPWLCTGDFNTIMWATEKKGGNPKNWLEMNNFRNTIAICNMSDLGFSGNRFTWSNGRGGAENILERLDRALASSEWKSLYPTYRVRHLPRFKSDHNPIVVDCSKNDESWGNPRKKGKRFRFEHMWIQHPNFTNLLEKIWKTGDKNASFMEKAKSCGNELLNWEKTEFGNIRSKIRNLRQMISDLQAQEQT